MTTSSRTGLGTGCIVLLVTVVVTSAFPGGNPQRCLRPCPARFDPVCDNEGTTHPNQCTMEVVSCRRRVVLYTEYRGMCQQPQSDTTVVPTPARNMLGRILRLFTEGGVQSTERCAFVCPFTYTPVCASNHRTYPNECTMKNQACTQHLTLTLLHEGPCQIWIR